MIKGEEPDMVNKRVCTYIAGVTYCWNKSCTRSCVKNTSPSCRVRRSWAFGLLMKVPPSRPERRSIKDATASSEPTATDPIYWSACEGSCDIVGLADALREVLIEGPAAVGEVC